MASERQTLTLQTRDLNPRQVFGKGETMWDCAAGDDLRPGIIVLLWGIVHAVVDVGGR